MKWTNDPTFESLEPRLMLDATLWLIDGADSGQVIAYDDAATTISRVPFAQANLLGAETDDTFVFTGPDASITGQIDGQGGADRLVYASYNLAALRLDLTDRGFDAATLAGIFDALPDATAGYGQAVTVNLQTGEATGAGSLVDVEQVDADDGQGAANTLVGPDAGGVWTVSSTDAGNIGGVGVFDFSRFASLVGGTGDDVFVFGSDATVSGSIAGGLGANAVDLSALSDALTWTLATDNGGAAGDIVSFSAVGQLTGSSGADAFIIADGVSVSSVDGSAGADTLDMSAYTATVNAEITGADAGSINSGLAFASIETIVSGDGDDVFMMRTGQSLSGAADGGTGADTLDYSDYGGDQSVSVNLQTGQATALGGGFSGIENVIGGAAWDDVLVGPDADTVWEITTDNAGRLDGGAVAFEGFESLQGGSGADSFVFSHATLLAIGLDGGSGADSLSLADYRTANTWNISVDNAGDLEVGRGVFAFASVETLIGGARVDTFVFADGTALAGGLVGGGDSDVVDLSARADAVAWTIDAPGAGDADGAVVFSQIENLISGSGDDTFAFTGDGSIADSLAGGAGADTLDLQATTAAPVLWNITADNAGDLNGSMAFDSIETLLAGGGDDTFHFASGRGVSGPIDAGDGYDTLDYSDYAADAAVTINRRTAQATGTAGYSGVEAVIGGAGEADALIGLDVDSQWTLAGDNSGAVNAAFDFQSIERLTGGATDDSFVFAADAVVTGSIDGADGDDTIDMGAYLTPVTWEIDRDYAGTMQTLGATLPIESIEHLAGGAGDDAFVFADRKRVDSVDGAAGVDRLDVTSFTTGVFVNTDDNYIAIDSSSTTAPRIGFASIEDIQKNDTGVVQENHVDLSASVDAAEIFSRITPNEKGVVEVAIRNEGNTFVDARIDITLTASSDAGDFALATAADQKIALHAGQTTVVKIPVTIGGDITPGVYDLVAHVDAGGAVEEINEVNNIAVEADPLNIVWEFGRVSGRTNVKLSVPDANGVEVTFALSGDGAGVIVGGSSFDAIYLTGTDAKTKLKITTERNAPVVEIHDVTAYGDLGAIIAPDVDLTGEMTIEGSLGSFQMNRVDGEVVVEGDLERIKVAQWDGGALTAETAGVLTTTGDRAEGLPGDFTATVNLTGVNAKGLSLTKMTVAGSILSADITLAGGAGSIVADQWTTSTFDAAYLGKLTLKGDRSDPAVAGDLRGTLTLTGDDGKGTSLGKLSVAGDVIDSTLTLTGAVGTVSVGRWTNSAVTATTAKSITARGDFQGTVALVGADAKGVSLAKMTVAADLVDSTVTLAGAGGTFSVEQWTRTDLTAQWAKSITTRGDRKDPACPGDFQGTVALASADAKGVSLGTLKAAGTLDGSEIRLAGSLNRLDAAALVDTDVLAGVAADVLQHATAHDDFVNPAATIKTVVVRGVKGEAGWFMTNSNLSAACMGNVSLRNVEFATSGLFMRIDPDRKTYRKISHLDTTTKAKWTSTPARPNGPDGFIQIV